MSSNLRPWSSGRIKPPRADVYERRQRDGRVYLALYDGRVWLIGSDTLAGALRQHVTSPLQTGAEWREIK